MYQIRDHRLFFNGQPVPFFPTNSQGGVIVPRWLIIHYTATGQSAQQVAQHFQTAEPRVSAHLTIDFDGSVVQSVNFNRAAFHAGRSEWQGVSGLNNHSIGIEVCNPGFLTPLGGWLPFTPAQNTALCLIGAALKHAYGLQDVLGHDDISPGRKSDPGPCCIPEVFDYIRTA
jgi:N-acetylmuramoyl-L-alanine amidase